ncbi:ESF1 homolog [Drosophila grimshawi]|uniref:GH12825 n=1 Tax=Drosophila grimshawi TaxID=7222 RepID=B4JLB3_DROGR|nr:ESF1 homolog [Drosophila grimshawi]EDW00366.1 GH12825 [Drosophila grimshawi]
MGKKPEKSVKPKAKPKKQEHPTISTKTSNADSEATGIWKDARFQHLLADPRFRGVPKVQRKVKIDKRFQGMFDDEKFKVKYTVDKYGRPVNKTNAEDLRKFYELDDNESSDEDVNEQAENKAKASSEDEERRAEELAIARDELSNTAPQSDSDDNDAELPKNLRERLTNPNIDYARGEGRLMTDSSDDESSDEDGEAGPELQIDHVWGELDIDAECTEESTRRLAVCNMDWDRIRAEDLMVLLSSFLPPGGSVLSVKIYPSEYGKARMAEEDVHGPTELVNAKAESDLDDSDEELVREQDSDAEEGDDYHMEKLRQYQLNRLRYYYAVVECDSVGTAEKVYRECDGIEYESSATRVDLRFIPDDTSFEEDMPTDESYELPDASNYKPRQFTTTALQQAKVDLTWDETALDRRELGDKLSSGKVEQLNDKELRQIVAYSSEEDEDEDEVEAEVDREKEQDVEPKLNKLPAAASKHLKQKERIEKYKNLLAEINAQEKQSKEKDYEMEMSWNVAEAAKPNEVKEPMGGSGSGSKAHLTPFEQVLQKRSEKNRLLKEQRRRMKLERIGIDPDEAAPSSDEDFIPDGIDMNDSYFADEFANGDYEQPKNTKKSKSLKQKPNKSTPKDEEAEAQLALLLDDNDDDGQPKQHFSLTKILKEEQTSSSKRKRRKQLKKSKSGDGKPAQDDDFKVDLNDERFNAVYKSHEYNIDPTNSNYKATKGMQQIIGEKLKRRHQQQSHPEQRANNVELEPAQKRSKQKLEQSALVKSLKLKIQQRKV